MTPGITRVSASYGQDSGMRCTNSGAIQIDATNVPDPANGDNQVFAQIWDSSACSLVEDLRGGTWTIRLTGDSVSGSGGDFDLWNQASRGIFAPYVSLSNFTLDESVAMPAPSRHAITAGAYVSKDRWINAGGSETQGGATNAVGGISSFSSIGPTRDGRIKPDVGAPGEFVGSALTGIFQSSCRTSCMERDGEHGNFRGTSMASPHVAGVAALLLALNRDLQGPGVKEAVRRAARADALTGEVPNTRFGYGKLRALEAASLGVSIVTDLAASPTAASPPATIPSSTPTMCIAGRSQGSRHRTTERVS